MKSMVEVVHMHRCNPPWGTQVGDVRIDRATKWGNPYRIVGLGMNPDKVVSRKESVEMYRKYVLEQIRDGKLDLNEIKDAKGFGCWCKRYRGDTTACHGDVLKELIELKLMTEG